MSLPRYIINFDELTGSLKKDLLGLIDDNLREKYPSLNTYNIQELLEEIKFILPSESYKGLKNKIDTIIYRNIEGIQKSAGRLLDIPPLIQENEVFFQFEKDVYLTGIHFNQTGWKKEDTWDLLVGKNRIINNSTIKEIGEHKHFNTYIKVEANTPISFILSNNSGNSRQTLVDIDYIEMSEISEIEEPDAIDIEDIPNEWNIAVVMNWEENSEADMDLHGYIDDKHVFYGNRSEDGFYLNFDFTNHIDNNNPEIISVKGYSNKKLDIYIHNYNRRVLRDPVNIKVYAKRSYGIRLLEEFDIVMSDDSGSLKGVCKIDLSTFKIDKLDLEKKVN